MSATKLRRILIGMLAAITIAGAFTLTFLYEQAQASPAIRQALTPPTPTPTQTQTQTCESCHPEEQKMWFEGRHSSARTDHVLNESTNCTACHPKLSDGQNVPIPKNGTPSPSTTQLSGNKMEDVNCMKCHTTGFNPSTGVSKSYGVTCEACHSPIPADHPTKKMPVNSSTDMCEKCHSDSRFNWTKWQDSKHYQQDMKCVECHDPHSTSLQHVGTDSADNSALCIRCHKDDKKMSPDSVHGKAGISCIKCHLGDKKGVDEFHVVPDHSFKVDIATCDGCHVDQIHRPASDQPVALNPSPTPTPTISIPSPTPDPVVQSQPANESNKQLLWLTFAGITGLIGLVIGIAIPNLKLLIKPKKRS